MFSTYRGQPRVEKPASESASIRLLVPFFLLFLGLTGVANYFHEYLSETIILMLDGGTVAIGGAIVARLIGLPFSGAKLTVGRKRNGSIDDSQVDP
jgi:hypothetical protein